MSVPIVFTLRLCVNHGVEVGWLVRVERWIEHFFELCGADLPAVFLVHPTPDSSGVVKQVTRFVGQAVDVGIPADWGGFVSAKLAAHLQRVVRTGLLAGGHGFAASSSGVGCRFH